MKKEIEELLFQVIASVGTAKSLYIEAIRESKENNFEKAKEKVEEANIYFLKGHESHGKLIQMDAKDSSVPFSLLLVHAEDLLMSADTFKILSDEFIDLYKKIYK
ncbi:MAG: PTS lactose/cellobiose transporter subunit IIA [Clostridium sp.]|nr:PTS lactose/cellobiose transporter subunit IIA [Clostridium sp.]